MESNHQRLALCSDHIVTPQGIRSGAVLITGGVIADIVDLHHIPEPFIREVYGGMVLMPGLVDTHVHINEPGRSEWEGFETATQAAAAGGITTLVDMPLNSSPVTTTGIAFEKKLDAARGKLYVDCAFHGGCIPGSLGYLASLLESGIFGVKVFLIDSGIDEFPNVIEGDLVGAMPLIGERGIPLLVHAEVDTGIRLGSTRRYADYLASRPPEMELKAIDMMIRLCRRFKCRTHIVHLSTADAVPALRRAKDEGLPLTVETCPHYLFFSSEEVGDGDTRFKCAPPIREAQNRDRLWSALEQGVIDCVVSDHSPCPPELKQPGSGDFLKAWGGISSLQFGLSAVWTEARNRGHSVVEIVRWMCSNPAGLVGLEKKKGSISVGNDADLVVWDPDGSIVVDRGVNLHKHKTTPYEGKKLRGRVHTTFLRGRKVYHDNRVDGPSGEILLRHQLHRAPAWIN